MSHIFISYSRQDQAYVSRLAQELESHQLPVWIDDRIDYGTTWPRVIQDHLQRCQVFIVVMSPRSEESHWVQCELVHAIEIRKPIFPLLLEGPRWPSVAALQTSDVTGGKLPPPRFFDTLHAHFATLPPITESTLIQSVATASRSLNDDDLDLEIKPGCWIDLNTYLIENISDQSAIKEKGTDYCKAWLEKAWELRSDARVFPLVASDKNHSISIQKSLERILENSANATDSHNEIPNLMLEESLIYKKHHVEIYYQLEAAFVLQRAVVQCLKSLDLTFNIDSGKLFYEGSQEYYETYFKWFNPAFVNREVWESFSGYHMQIHGSVFSENYHDSFTDFVAHIMYWSIENQTSYLRLSFSDEQTYFSNLALSYLGTCKHLVEAKNSSYISRESFLIAFYDWAIDRGFNPQICFDNSCKIHNAKLRII